MQIALRLFVQGLNTYRRCFSVSAHKKSPNTLIGVGAFLCFDHVLLRVA